MTRRRVPIAVVAVAAVAAAAALLHHREPRRGAETARVRTGPAAVRPVDWPTYGFVPARTHAAPFALVPPFRVLWKQTADWSLIEFPPVVAGGRLYFGTNHGLVLALDAATGDVVWRRELGRCIASSPAVDGVVVIVGVMGTPASCDEDVPSFVVALDRRDGRTRWLFRTGGPVESSPLVVGRLVVVGSWDGSVFALDAASGRIRWRFATHGPVKGGAALARGIVFAGSYDGFVYALDAGNGNIRWKADAGGRIYATPSVADGRVVVASTDGVVHAFASAGGAELWSRRIGRFAYSAAALTGGRAYVGSYDHRLYALDAANGAVLWTRLGPGPVSGAPAAIGRLIWFSTCGSCSSYESNPRARRTFVVDALTGEPVWSFPDGEYSPAVTDGLRVYLTGYTALYGLAPARR